MDLKPGDEARDLLADMALCAAATPGPWEERRRMIGDYHADSEIVGAPVHYLGKRVGGAVVGKLYAGFVWFEGDCAFIPASREGWPAAIRLALHYKAEAKRLAARLDEYERPETR